MYKRQGTCIAWVDYYIEGLQLSPQHQSVLDMSIKTIDQYLNLLESIMQEWEKISGVNRQRQGGIGPYEGKATSQQAIVQSSHITEDVFRKYSRFEQRELQGLIDYSKEAWLSGKKGMYVMPDMTTEMIDIDSMQHMETEYGIFVSDAGRDQDKLEQAKALFSLHTEQGTSICCHGLFDTENYAVSRIRLHVRKQRSWSSNNERHRIKPTLSSRRLSRCKSNRMLNKRKTDSCRLSRTIKAEASDSQDKLNIDMLMQQNFELAESWISSNRL